MLWSDELASADFYNRLLNAGFRLPATGGTDNFSEVFRDPPPGSARTFARIDGPFTVGSWLDAIRHGRTFMSTGPLLLLDVEGREPGDDIALPAAAPARLRVRAEALSIAPLDSLQIIVNGRAAHTVRAGDDYAFAHTSPVYVTSNGRTFVNLDDVRFQAETVDAIWSHVEDSRWRSAHERDRFRAAVDSAKAVYARIAASAAH